jgi:hypothetical protein
MLSEDIEDCVNYRTINKEILEVVLNSSLSYKLFKNINQR